MHLLYLPDRPRDAYLIKALSEAGHVVEIVADWAEAQALAATGQYDAALLDAAHPDIARVRRIAQAAKGAAVVVLAEAATPAERTEALRAGADACFVRPLHFIELELRLEALSRRAPAPAALGGMTLAAAERTARLGEHSLALSPQEFRLLDYLARHPGAVLPADRIQANVWGDDSDLGPDLVRTSVSRLRRRLERAFGRGFILTVRGHGYRFEPEGLEDPA
jgi:two-component system OmpR family response regulator